jgi:rhamnose transport system ATP-binding protein
MTSPQVADRLGVALLPADRKRQGLFAMHPISFNIAAGNLSRLRRARWFTDRAAERTRVTALAERLRIKAPSIRQRIGALSGGNQQKTVLARLVLGSPRVLILQEPTQGVDVGAKDEIHRIVAELAAGGAGVLLVSSDLPEVLRLADRIAVMRDGRITAWFTRDALDTDVLAAAAGRFTVEARRDGDD